VHTCICVWTKKQLFKLPFSATCPDSSLPPWLALPLPSLYLSLSASLRFHSASKYFIRKLYDFLPAMRVSQIRKCKPIRKHSEAKTSNEAPTFSFSLSPSILLSCSYSIPCYIASRLSNTRENCERISWADELLFFDFCVKLRTYSRIISTSKIPVIFRSLDTFSSRIIRVSIGDRQRWWVASISHEWIEQFSICLAKRVFVEFRVYHGSNK